MLHICRCRGAFQLWANHTEKRTFLSKYQVKHELAPEKIWLVVLVLSTKTRGTRTQFKENINWSSYTSKVLAFFWPIRCFQLTFSVTNKAQSRKICCPLSLKQQPSHRVLTVSGISVQQPGNIQEKTPQLCDSHADESCHKAPSIHTGEEKPDRQC